jgi:fructose-1,6-bisphosphatase/inositol monophosphatase family enzyme
MATARKAAAPDAVRLDCLNRLLHIARAGHTIALDPTSRARRQVKPDGSILTQTDLSISRLATAVVADLVATGTHLLIDEEDKTVNSLFASKKLAAAEYVWVIDPIDGTRPYAAGLPMYGITMGILRHGTPWMGFCHYPALNVLYLHDGVQAWVIEAPFTAHEHRRPLTKAHTALDQTSVLYTTKSFARRFAMDVPDVFCVGAGILPLCWTADGLGCGTIFRGNLWDFAGAWPLFAAAGLEMRAIGSNAPLRELDLSHFGAQKDNPWYLNDDYLIAAPALQPKLRARFSPLAPAVKPLRKAG